MGKSVNHVTKGKSSVSITSGFKEIFVKTFKQRANEIQVIKSFWK